MHYFKYLEVDFGPHFGSFIFPRDYEAAVALRKNPSAQEQCKWSWHLPPCRGWKVKGGRKQTEPVMCQ